MTELRRLFDLVEVTWEDTAAHENVWMDSIAALTPHLIRSSGSLVFCDENYVVIAQDVDQEGQHNGRSQIPRGLVRQMEVLKKADGA